MNLPADLRSAYFYTAPNIRLHAKVCGPADAPVLMFVHGFPEFWYTWRHQLAEFAPDYRCVAVDLRGFNLSSQPAEVAAYKPSLLLQDLQSVVAQLGAPVKAVVAHDWGGALCWSFAAQHPECMESLVILNAPHTLPFAHAMAHDPQQQAASQYMNDLRSPGAEQRLTANDFAAMASLFGPQGDGDPALYRACWRHGLAGGCNLYRASPLHPDTPDTPGKLASLLPHLKAEDFRVNVPTQIIWGTGDPALRPVLLEGIEQHVPNVIIHRIEGASHWLPHANAVEVNTVLRAFLARP